MKIKARYSGKCARCGDPIKAGDEVEYDPECKSVMHPQCAIDAEDTEASPIKPVQAGTTARYRSPKQEMEYQVAKAEREHGIRCEMCRSLSQTPLHYVNLKYVCRECKDEVEAASEKQPKRTMLSDAEVGEIMAQRDKYENALSKITAHVCPTYDSCGCGDIFKEIAREALK